MVGKKWKGKKRPFIIGVVGIKRRVDTVGVSGSNPHAPTNLFNKLYLASPAAFSATPDYAN
jgi:hypothetical protein